jgi:hypothetical protein
MKITKKIIAYLTALTLFAIGVGESFAALGLDSVSSYTSTFYHQDHSLRPEVLKLALTAYFNAHKMGIGNDQPILTIIDYSLPSSQKRFWVLDLSQEKILYQSLVAHGKNSGKVYTTSFSDHAGTLSSSLGLYLTANTYAGHHGCTLKIKGLEQGFNDLAEARRIVIHGANYVSEKIASLYGGIGRSWGCPAVEPQLAMPIINTIKGGTLVFAYYPDHNWLSHSKFINYQV